MSPQNLKIFLKSLKVKPGKPESKSGHESAMPQQIIEESVYNTTKIELESAKPEDTSAKSGHKTANNLNFYRY